MKRSVLLSLALLSVAPGAAAQLMELDAGARSEGAPLASASLPSAPLPSARGPVLPPAAPASTSTSSSERLPPGPALRERSARRSRGGSTMSGILMLTMLVGLMGYYVVKRLRR